MEPIDGRFIGLSPAFYAAMALYGVAALTYFVVFFDVKPRVGRIARLLLLGAVVAHTVDIALLDIRGVHPGTSVREMIGALGWLIAAGYLIVGLKYRLGVLGGFIAPVVLVMLGAARLTPTGEELSGLTALGRIHIFLAMIGIALFALATALGTIYLLEARNLKNKKFNRILFRRGVALETLDTLLHRLILFGFPIFTLSMMLGAVWATQRSVSWFSRPEYAVAMVTWVAFGGLLLGRITTGWRGRKAALLTIAGFTASVVVLLIYLARRVMG
jgi:ABC-type uncharacterized transport system permease subunit